jgi:DNA-binding Lrp family transcriptional regulator
MKTIAYPELDRLDLTILRKLSEDGRISWRDLSDQIGLSLTPTLRRVRRLEAEGYIEGYTALFDERRLLGAMSVFVSVTLESQSGEALAAFEERIVRFPEVMSVFLMTGGSDYLIRAVLPDLDAYQDLLSALTRIPGVARIQSSFAVKTVIKRSTPVL